MNTKAFQRIAGVAVAIATLFTLAASTALASQIVVEDLPKNAADVGKVFQDQSIVVLARVNSIAPYNTYDEQGQAMSIEDSSGRYLASVSLDIEKTYRTEGDEGPISPVEMIEMCGLKQDGRYLIGLAKRDPNRPGGMGYEKGEYTIARAMRIDENGRVLDHEWTGQAICTLEEAVKAIGETRNITMTQTTQADAPYRRDGRNWYSITASKAAYVYASAKTNAKKLLVVSKGDSLLMAGDVVNSGGKRFVRVVLDGGNHGPSYGYVLESSVTKTKDGKAVERTALYQGKCAIVTVDASRYVYQEQNTKSARIGVARKGTAFAVASPVTGKWNKVFVGGRIGYIPAKNISSFFDEDEPNP